jgi:SAM-dependent methyltransferase
MHASPDLEMQSNDETDYERRIREQIEQYESTLKIHDLPQIFHDWTHLFVAPGVKHVYGVTTIADAYAECFLDSARATAGRPQFLSLGCGEGTMEIDIAKRLISSGLNEFEFLCIDLSPPLLRRFAEQIPQEMTACFNLRSADINRNLFDRQFHAIMANHSLHHMVELEEIFTSVFVSLHDRGSFVTNDMIGRNGHQRWPETRLFVDFVWPFLTERQRINLALRRHEEEFMDHDCSTVGFEGIRAQDILPLILRTGFKSHSFFGFGGFIDPFVDRGFGHNLSAANADDLFLIRRLGLLNEILLDTGVIKPTVMLARFVKYDTPEIAYRGRTSVASLRNPDEDPEWLAGALADKASIGGTPSFVFRQQPSEAAALRDAFQKLSERATLLEAKIAEQAAAINALHTSTSWRATALLRSLGRRLHRAG